MNFYRVTYPGRYLGATAIVAADSEEEAIELVNSDPRTHDGHDGKVAMKVFHIPVPGACVLYNDNGDY
jgi:hypothetical protein